MAKASSKRNDPSLEPLRRLLRDAPQGGQAKVDALFAFLQRKALVPTLNGNSQALRTLINRQRESALAVFSGTDSLNRAAMRYGWMGSDGTVSHAEHEVARLIQLASDRNYPYLVVDIGSEHALEIEREEFGSLLAASRSNPPTGPYAGAGRITAQLREAIASSRPPSPRSHRPAESASGARAVPPPSADGGPRTHAVPQSTNTPRSTKTPRSTNTALPARTPLSAKTPSGVWSFAPVVAAPPLQESERSWSFFSPRTLPSKDALHQASAAVSAFPEVELAYLANVITEQSAKAEPCVAIYIDGRHPLDAKELSQRLAVVLHEAWPAFSLINITNPTILRNIREVGLLLYPWQAAP